MESKGCNGYQDWKLSRRALIGASAAGLLTWLTPSAISQVIATPQRTGKNTVVVVFLRGGADGLNMVAPYADDIYQSQRPNLRISGPSKGRKDAAIDLNGYFGLHPKLAPLEGMFKEGQLAVIHAVGSQDHTRSHFEAMNAMDRGLAHSGPGDASGWLARYLNANPRSAPLRAVSFSGVLPDSLKGGAGAINLASLLDYKLDGDEAIASGLHRMYTAGTDEIGSAGFQTLNFLNVLNKLDFKTYQSRGQAVYPDTDLGNGLKQAAFLVKGHLGVEVVAIDTYGWDTHVGQGAAAGSQGDLLAHLASCLQAFSRDMGKEMDRVTVIVQTEFGRRLYENGGLGTDHGRASCMLVLGGGVRGGHVYGKWPGLEKAALEGDDLRVTTDYRSVLGEVLQKRMEVADLQPIFGTRQLPSLGILD